MTAVNQLIIGGSRADAITSMAIAMRCHLRAAGPSEVYALHLEHALAGDVRRTDEMPLGSPRDVLIYHASYGDPHVTRFLRARPERLVLVYHNITPSEFFVETDPTFAAGLEWGRHELDLLRDRVVLSFAVSAYNAGELTAKGYRDPIVVPIGLQPDRLVAEPDDVDALDEVASRMPPEFVVGVSQFLPHKRQDVIMQAIHVLQSCAGRDIGVILVGTPRARSYWLALHELARRLRMRHVWLASGLDDGAVATVVRRAAAFVSASEHEGLGIPPIEAMALGVPAIGRDAGATRETFGGAGWVLPRDAGPLLYAGAIARVVDDRALRDALAAAGRARAAELAFAARPEAWLPHIRLLVR